MENNSSVKLWKSVCIACEPEFEDLVSTLIFESGFSGLEERNESGSFRFKAYYPLSFSPDPLDTLRELLETTFGKDAGKRVSIYAVETIPGEDWEKGWRAGLGAVETGKRLVIRPSWVNYCTIDERIEIIIDPKMAFGTGSHATTFLCLEALERLNIAGRSVIDAGCGSGVLSIAAAKLGASRVFAFDNDPFSVDNACENVLINGMQDVVQVELADLEKISSTSSLTLKPADLVLANIIYHVLVRQLPLFRSFMNPGGEIVFSGLLSGQETPFLENMQKEGFHILSVSHREEWIAVIANLLLNSPTENPILCE
ncbi:MAG: 50S ribosomal protein L11 methyltransferase [Candidatus Latescibacter sp.]|nr:50S ribosomal protein L11 methyltransferase [Candidatus Latescibacter sp.]